MSKVFILVHKVTGEKQKVVADSAEEACEKMDWFMESVNIKEIKR